MSEDVVNFVIVSFQSRVLARVVVLLSLNFCRQSVKDKFVVFREIVEVKEKKGRKF